MKQTTEVTLELPEDLASIFDAMAMHRKELTLAKDKLAEQAEFYSQKQSGIEKRLAEFMHLIELNNLNQKEINLVYKELHKVLQERRFVKDMVWAIQKRQTNASFEVKTIERIYEYTLEPLKTIAAAVQERTLKA
jgi:hypothetical protein